MGRLWRGSEFSLVRCQPRSDERVSRDEYAPGIFPAGVALGIYFLEQRRRHDVRLEKHGNPAVFSRRSVPPQRVWRERALRQSVLLVSRRGISRDLLLVAALSG